MNFYDSGKISDLLKTHGFTLTDNIKETDLAVINTCHIREKASEKLFSDLGRLNKIKRRYKRAWIPMRINRRQRRRRNYSLRRLAKLP